MLSFAMKFLFETDKLEPCFVVILNLLTFINIISALASHTALYYIQQSQ